MKMRKILKCIALPMAIVMLFSTAAFARPHPAPHHHGGGDSNGWGWAAAGLVGGLLIGAIASSSRQEQQAAPVRQDPGVYRQDPGVGYAPQADTSQVANVQPAPVQTGARREVELAEKVPGGVMINGQFYAPASR